MVRTESSSSLSSDSAVVSAWLVVSLVLVATLGVEGLLLFKMEAPEGEAAPSVLPVLRLAMLRVRLSIGGAVLLRPRDLVTLVPSECWEAVKLKVGRKEDGSFCLQAANGDGRCSLSVLSAVKENKGVLGVLKPKKDPPGEGGTSEGLDLKMEG